MAPLHEWEATAREASEMKREANVYESFDDRRTSGPEAARGSDGRNAGVSVVGGGMRKLQVIIRAKNCRESSKGGKEQRIRFGSSLCKASSSARISGASLLASMASLSGSGGKIVRDRQRDQPPRPSPYARSPPLALPPPPPPAGSPRWLIGLVSGAGKLISSVFRADSSVPDSADYSSDQDRSSSRSDEQNIDAPKQLHGSSRELKKSEEIADCMELSHAIVPGSETKLAIEKLLQQEIFSRDEYERLTKLLQSRVVDSPSVFVQDKVGEAISNGLPGNTVDFSGESLQQCNVLPGSVAYSPIDFSSHSVKSSFSMSDVHKAAATKANKWLELKKMPFNSKFFPPCGPSALNTDMLHHDVHDDASPVDLAESYMQSLPPQQSPSAGSITLPSMIASKEDLQTDSSNHARTSNSLSSIKTSNAPAKSLEEHVEDLRCNDGGSLVDKPIDEDIITLAVKSTSVTLTSEPMETLEALVEKTASPTISSLGPTPTEHQLPIYLDANKDVSKPSSTVLEDIINNDAPHESFISASASKVPDDAKPQNQNLCSLHATDGSRHDFSKKGGSTESNVAPQLVSQEKKSFNQFSNGGEQTTDVAKVIKEHPSMDTTPVRAENHITTKSRKVRKRESIEHVSVSPRPHTRQQAKREGQVGGEKEQRHRPRRASKRQ
ncbi:hypothetical protein ZIOFF_046335 [Zingiber officinale]|uniref:Protein KAKU4 n=1 Tax=Zingiber officinale TaxID=94328 RepID=A0A8J5GE52_ZINOF|nr:hypothetical protein ZIOFF_046335 [Zingiber officinale]